MRFLQEDNGNYSSMRLAMLLCVIGAIGMGFLGLYLRSELLGLTSLCGMFLGAGIGGKVWQKGKEKTNQEEK